MADEHLDAFERLAADRLHQRKLVNRIRRDHVWQIDAMPLGPTLVRRIAFVKMQHVFGRRVDKNEASLIVGDDHAVAHAVQDRLQDSRLFRERRLGARQLVGTLLSGSAALGDTSFQCRIECFQFLLRSEALGTLPVRVPACEPSGRDWRPEARRPASGSRQASC